MCMAKQDEKVVEKMDPLYQNFLLNVRTHSCSELRNTYPDKRVKLDQPINWDSWKLNYQEITDVVVI